MVMSNKPADSDKRTTRTLDRNHDGKRGANRTDRHERAHGIALDERGQEQPTDRERARDSQGVGSIDNPPSRDR